MLENTKTKDKLIYFTSNEPKRYYVSVIRGRIKMSACHTNMQPHFRVEFTNKNALHQIT